jgi:hypothetical protein
MIPRAGLAEKKQNHRVDAAALLATPPLAPALQKSPTADPDSPTHPESSDIETRSAFRYRNRCFGIYPQTPRESL